MSVEFSSPWTNYREFGWLYFLHIEPQSTEHGSTKRPGIIYCIGIIDILAAVCYMAVAMYGFMNNPASGPYEQAYFYLGIMGIVVRIQMGVFLLKGLKSENDCTTLWYCRLWMACQITFCAASVIDITSVGLTFMYNSPGTWEAATSTITVVIFIYRVASLCLMNAYTKTLKHAEVRTRQQEEVTDEVSSSELKPASELIRF